MELSLRHPSKDVCGDVSSCCPIHFSHKENYNLHPKSMCSILHLKHKTVHVQVPHSNYCKNLLLKVCSQKCVAVILNDSQKILQSSLSEYTVNFLRCQKFWLILVNAVSHCARCIISPTPLPRLPGLWFPAHCVDPWLPIEAFVITVVCVVVRYFILPHHLLLSW